MPASGVQVDHTGMIKKGRRTAAWIVLMGSALVWPLHAQGQESVRTGRVDVELFYATISGLWWSLPHGWRIGPELGLGLRENVTARPTDADFSPLVSIGAVGSRSLSGRSSVDLGVRIGAGDILRVCPASDCYPQRYLSFLGGLAYGGTRWRAGTRVEIGRQDGETILAWSPVFLRVRF